MGLFGKSNVLTEYEQKLLDSIKGMCDLEDTIVMIDHENMDCYVINERKHYKLIIHSSSLLIENTIDFNEESFKDYFIDMCKKPAFDRDKKNRLKIKEGILARKTAMADRMLNALTSNKSNE